MELKTEIVKFRDGSQITVTEENWDIGMQRERLEDELRQQFLDKKISDEDFGRRTLYIKMSVCSSGDVPTQAKSREWPSVEIDKWYQAVRRINPSYFKAIDALMDEKAKVQKKGRKRRA